MPHYQTGEEAKIGDRCRFEVTQYDATRSMYVEVQREALIFDIQPGCETCNAQVAYPALDVVKNPDGETRVLRMITQFVTLALCQKAA